MSSDQILTAIVSIAAPVLGGGGFWVWLSSKKKDPITDVDTRIISAERLQQMAYVSAEAANRRSAVLEEDVEELKRGLVEERQSRQKQTSDLEHRIAVLDRAVRILSTAWDDLRTRWDEVRQSETPPDKPTIHL